MTNKVQNSAVIKEVIMRCWENPTTKQRFLDNPHSVLLEYGIVVETKMNIHVCENSEKNLHIVIPIKPPPHIDPYSVTFRL